MNQCVAITGSTTGIGYAIAEAFAHAGARLVINSHLADDGGAAARLGKLTECHFVQADLSTVDGAQGFVAAAQAKLGRLDTLVNNAGTYLDTNFDDLTEAAFDRTFNLNVKGYLFAAQAFVKGLSPEQENPSIICTGSTNSLAAEKNSVIYDTSKGAVLMLVRNLAVTLAERGIRVNGIGPGIIETPLSAKGLAAPGVRPALERQIPLGRVGMPADIGGAAVFLASPAARYITGQMLYVDGGILANQMSWEPQA
ncbi:MULTISPECIES: SDR family oxidoreductase [unclassified Devosia]|uniref:SDR family NAD(P)-dependent oxidoreductase n=1 Tax=unclassified Devosia TaxID=196773 RepID=UPI00086D6E53|nr:MULTISPECIES: SDR family oxidoreductase [unclassified Devosia]MBN9363303.1 SDR family oxidoreductase [Devosia sp.]ODS83724.1 MAG: short-chain dehydrogenase [Devosia sp. SCN 66-27]OJX25140.1 MAG: short-chain dehydrogenase [Devosia sp. 66-14]